MLSDEQKSIPWEDPLPRSNSISSSTNPFNPQLATRKSNNSISHERNSHNLNSVNNNKESSFYNSPVLNLNSINNNHLLNNDILAINHSQHFHKTPRKLEHTPSARSTVSSEDSWCPSDDHHENDDISSYNEDDENLSDRSNSLISGTRNSQLRLTFNKAKQHLSFDKWRNSSSTTMPSSSNQESPGEPLSRLSRWFSIRRGSQQYELNTSNGSPLRSGSIEKENGVNSPNDKKMLQLQEVRTAVPLVMTQCSQHLLFHSQTEEDQSEVDAVNPLVSVDKMDYRMPPPLVLPPPPTSLSQSQLKRRHIISAIIHSENSYLSALQRLVKVSQGEAAFISRETNASSLLSLC